MNQCHECGEFREDLEAGYRYSDGTDCMICTDCFNAFDPDKFNDGDCHHERTDFDDAGRVWCLDCGEFMGAYR